MIYTAVDNFYLSDAELANSPSRADGISAEAESTMRVLGAELIQEAGVLLGAPQAVMATGQILLQRFYCKKSLKECNLRRLAPSCLFLAAKLEEFASRPRLLRDVILVFDRIMKRREGRPLVIMEVGQKEYTTTKDYIIRFELILLKTFGFIVHAQHPHTFVVNYVRMLTVGVDDDSPLFQEAWNICNDSLRTPLCVRFKPEVIACGAIFLAARRLKIALPEAPAWWTLYSVKTEQLVEVVRTLHDLYLRPKAEYVHGISAAVPGAAAGPAPADGGTAGDSPALSAPPPLLELGAAGAGGGADRPLLAAAAPPVAAAPADGAADSVMADATVASAQVPASANGHRAAPAGAPSVREDPRARSSSRDRRTADGASARDGGSDRRSNGERRRDASPVASSRHHRREQDRRDADRTERRDPDRRDDRRDGDRGGGDRRDDRRDADRRDGDRGGGDRREADRPSRRDADRQEAGGGRDGKRGSDRLPERRDGERRERARSRDGAPVESERDAQRVRPRERADAERGREPAKRVRDEPSGSGRDAVKDDKQSGGAASAAASKAGAVAAVLKKRAALSGAAKSASASATPPGATPPVVEPAAAAAAPLSPLLEVPAGASVPPATEEDSPAATLSA